MTLLEAVIAFVILAVVGVACLDQSRGASQLQRASADWSRAVARGESAMAAAASGTYVAGDTTRDVNIVRRAWAQGIEAIDVTVTLPNGSRYVTSRLVPTGAVTTSAITTRGALR